MAQGFQRPALSQAPLKKRRCCDERTQVAAHEDLLCRVPQPYGGRSNHWFATFTSSLSWLTPSHPPPTFIPTLVNFPFEFETDTFRNLSKALFDQLRKEPQMYPSDPSCRLLPGIQEDREDKPITRRVTRSTIVRRMTRSGREYGT